MAEFPQCKELPLKMLTKILGVYLRVWRVFVHIFCIEGDRGIRLLISLSSLTWAYMLLDFSYLFRKTPPLYFVMGYMGSEQGWALLFLFSGFFGVVTNLFEVRTKLVLCLDAFFGALVWSFSTLACFAAFWPLLYHTGFFGQLSLYVPPAALAGSIWITLFSWWGFIRRATEQLD